MRVPYEDEGTSRDGNPGVTCSDMRKPRLELPKQTETIPKPDHATTVAAEFSWLLILLPGACCPEVGLQGWFGPMAWGFKGKGSLAGSGLALDLAPAWW